MQEINLSPRLKQLQQEIEAGHETAVSLFWQSISTQDTPLIEPSEDNKFFSLVTFIWRGVKATTKVILQISVDGTGQDEHEMVRLLDTDIWYNSMQLRNDYRGAYKFIVHQDEIIETHDPLNSKTFLEPKDEERADHTEDDIDSIFSLPDAPSQHWAIVRNDTEKGSVTQHSFTSNILNNQRRVWVYTPPNDLVSPEAYPLLIVLDGRFFTFAIDTPTILDNLLAEKQTPPFVAVMVDNPGPSWEASMAIREKELACYPPFAQFLSQELVPWVQQNYQVSTKGADTFIAGGSFGGLAATFSALKYPLSFGNVIALSSSFWWKPQGDDEWEWLAQQFIKTELSPLRFYLEVGLLESKPTQSGFPGQVLANRHLRNILLAKGYEVHYDEQMHGHDSTTWQDSLADGLICLSAKLDKTI